MTTSYYKHIKLEVERDSLFSDEGKNLLNRYYSDGKEGVQRAIARAAYNYCYGDNDLAQFIYDAASKHWFFYSSPILSNAIDGDWAPNVDYRSKEFWADGNTMLRTGAFVPREKQRGLPISCFGTLLGDSIKEQIEASSEVSLLSVAGGGTSLHSRIRAVSDKAPGPIAYLKTIDGAMGYYRQGKTRRGSCAVYMDISHPDIIEFIHIRRLAGGDIARKVINRQSVHHGINITNAFVEAVDNNLDWELVDPATNTVREVLPARQLWEQILKVREETGEPYLWFVDVANEALPEVQKRLGLRNHGSNLCSEISLATSSDRSFVCCLSSLNLEKYDEWKDTPLVEKLTQFLDNVIQWYIDYAPPELHRTVKSARAERALGIGAMGWHNLLMKRGIPFESGGFNSASQINHEVFSLIKQRATKASRNLADLRGCPSDMEGTNLRNSHLLAIAPNSNSSILCNTSPSIEPIASNAYTQKGRAGIFLVKNRFLEPVLEKYGLNNDATWKSIIDNNGSVAHLSQLSETERNVFKTAWEIDQHWLVQHAEDRQVYICQAQSLNLFFLPGTDRGYINSVHLKAARGRKVKSLYYFRTGSAVQADTIKAISRRPLTDWKGDDCVACQG
ncbi:MAG TPA: ribonucleoside-diphosphate reductase subunit alpha [Methanosarcina sp.]|nr:ribonucleoside-diphosphate reductase subunit alpha [Methanosarcina sp.]